MLQESAAVVTAGTPLLELGDPRDLEVEIDVLSRDAVKIHPARWCSSSIGAATGPLQGRVRLVEPSGFTKISTLGVEEQRVNVIVDLVDPPEARTTLGDGFRVEARIVIDEADDVLKVPTSALFRVGKESAVFKVVDGVVHQQIVEDRPAERPGGGSPRRPRRRRPGRPPSQRPDRRRRSRPAALDALRLAVSLSRLYRLRTSRRIG